MRAPRFKQPFLLVWFGALLFAACTDATAPSVRENAAREATDELRNAAIITVRRDATSAEFIVDKDGGWFKLGPHAIYFPAESICDPATSGYGPTEWDKRCVPLQAPIRIHARISETPEGLSQIAFSPDLRFVPSKKQKEWIYLYFATPEARRRMSSEELKKQFTILWSPAAGVPGIDESLTDKTLITRVDTKAGIVYRRIKHFSNYQVTQGFMGPLPIEEPKDDES